MCPGKESKVAEKKRILIVEDEKMLQELYYTILTRKQYQEKYEVEKAASAEEALHLFEKQACDLVFTDYHLPKMDGLTL
jgi:CheY-like chemotaxis protein